jgi:hypothetical protein
MFNVKIHEFAYQDLNEGVVWYDSQMIGLGEKFKQEIVKQVANISKNPSWFLIEQDNIYKAYIPKYPYKILYSFTENNIIIWAIAHMHRKPNYWKNRT